MTDIYSYQGGALAAVRAGAPGLDAEIAGAIVGYNKPSKNLKAQSILANVVAAQNADVTTTQAGLMAVVRGRTADPAVRAWTFSLDGHDFYVLRLGDDATLIYDTYAKKWTEWSSGGLPFWRARCGVNWLGAKMLESEYGSSIVAGDDTFGVLWFLDPEQGYDDSVNATRAQQQRPYPRIVSAQFTLAGREAMPCYSIFLAGDNYGMTATDFTPTVELEYSDDQGRTFVSAGVLEEPANYAVQNPYQWLSLGQITAPGRIFRFIDNGALARIDAVEMNDGE